MAGAPLVFLEALCSVGLVIMMKVSSLQKSSACDGAAEVSGLNSTR